MKGEMGIIKKGQSSERTAPFLSLSETTLLYHPTKPDERF